MRLAFAVAFIGLAALPPRAAADLSGEAAAGLVLTTGNSETQSQNTKLTLTLPFAERWKSTFTGTTLNNSNEEGTTAERYTASGQLNFDFTENGYAFGLLDYEKDLFGGIRERKSETLGYGRHILEGGDHTLDAEIGAGARQTEANETGEKESEAIGRANINYKWKLTDTSELSEVVKVESGSSNTLSESTTELKLSIIGNLLANISFNVRNNTDVPPESESTDTTTGLALAYQFGPRE